MALVYISRSSFGGVPGIGTPVPAICPIHGAFTGWLPFSLQGHQGFMDRSTIACPKCGRPGLLPQGPFDFTREVVHDLIGVRFSRPQRRRIERLVHEAKTPEDALVRANRIDKRLGAAVKKTWRLPNWQEGLAILALIVSLMADLPAAVNTADMAVEWVNEQLMLRQQESESPQKSGNKHNQQDTVPDQDTLGDGANGSNQGWDDLIDT